MFAKLERFSRGLLNLSEEDEDRNADCSLLILLGKLQDTWHKRNLLPGLPCLLFMGSDGDDSGLIWK